MTAHNQPHAAARQIQTNNPESGQILILGIIFMLVVLILIAGLVDYTVISSRAHRAAVASEQALSIAEAGIEKAIWKLNNQPGYSGETSTAFSNGVYDISITNLSGSSKLIRATARVPSAANPAATRIIQVTTAIGTTNIGFNYGVQVGLGGMDMGNNAIINGNIYSNANIVGQNGARINGDAFAAGPTGTINNVDVQVNTRSHFIVDSTVGGDAFHYDLDNTTVTGNLSTHSMSNCTVGGDATYNTSFGCTVSGTASSPNSDVPEDPEVIPLPITPEQILEWETEAADGGVLGTQTISGTTTTLGPKKIVGDLILTNNTVLTLTGTIWVTGSITFNNNSTVKLDPAYGNLSGLIIAGTAGSTTAGTITTINNSQILGSGTAGSYLMLLSQKEGTASTAITVRNNATAAIFYAGAGRIDVSENAGAKEITAEQIRLDNNAVVTYESGLANANFSSGPGGGWEIARQTWQLLR